MGPAVAQAELSLLTWCVCVGGGCVHVWPTQVGVHV